jgi:AP-3 complex subunit mu
MATIEALYIFDEHKYVSSLAIHITTKHNGTDNCSSNLILNNVYTGRPPAPSTLLPLYLQQPSPRPSLTYISSTNPPTLLYSIIQDNLLFLSPSSSDIEPLLVLEFLHRVADALEEFLGSPLLASRITASYDVVAQVLAEMADAGIVCQGEANVLRDVVETGPGVLDNLFGKVGLPGSSPALGSTPSSVGMLQRSQPSAMTSQGSAIPWRRNNVRHTSNELYVDIVESLSVTFAPSGRPLAAFANGSIAFTSKVSGVPDLNLNLSTGGKGAGMGNRGDQLRSIMERVVFHPCVRLNRWKGDGSISFVPPDGRFALCGYEADLLGPDSPLTTDSRSAPKLDLPANIVISTGSGAMGNEFEVRLTLPSSTRSAATASLQSNLSNPGRPGAFRSALASENKGPAVEELAVRIPMPQAARNLSDIRPTKGEAHWSPADGSVEWRISSKDVATISSAGAVLRCTVQVPLTDEDDEEEDNGIMNRMTATTYDYDDDTPSSYQAQSTASKSRSNGAAATSGIGKAEKNRELMPTAAMLSFSVKGWLASGLKVESLVIDTKKSKSLGAEVKPYKGVKYLTVSKEGVEVRC